MIGFTVILSPEDRDAAIKAVEAQIRLLNYERERLEKTRTALLDGKEEPTPVEAKRGGIYDATGHGGETP